MCFVCHSQYHFAFVDALYRVCIEQSSRSTAVRFGTEPKPNPHHAASRRNGQRHCCQQVCATLLDVPLWCVSLTIATVCACSEYIELLKQYEGRYSISIFIGLLCVGLIHSEYVAAVLCASVVVCCRLTVVQLPLAVFLLQRTTSCCTTFWATLHCTNKQRPCLRTCCQSWVPCPKIKVGHSLRFANNR
jgi:hypothetical protein